MNQTALVHFKNTSLQCLWPWTLPSSFQILPRDTMHLSSLGLFNASVSTITATFLVASSISFHSQESRIATERKQGALTCCHMTAQYLASKWFFTYLFEFCHFVKELKRQNCIVNPQRKQLKKHNSHCLSKWLNACQLFKFSETVYRVLSSLPGHSHGYPGVWFWFRCAKAGAREGWMWQNHKAHCLLTKYTESSSHACSHLCISWTVSSQTPGENVLTSWETLSMLKMSCIMAEPAAQSASCSCAPWALAQRADGPRNCGPFPPTCTQWYLSSLPSVSWGSRYQAWGKVSNHPTCRALGWATVLHDHTALLLHVNAGDLLSHKWTSC